MKYATLSQLRQATSTAYPSLAMSARSTVVGPLRAVTDPIFGTQTASFYAECGCDCPENRRTVGAIGRWARNTTQSCGVMEETIITTSTKGDWTGAGAPSSEFTSAPSEVVKTVIYTRDGPSSTSFSEWSNGESLSSGECAFGLTSETTYSEDPDGTTWEIYYNGSSPSGGYTHSVETTSKPAEDRPAVAPGFRGEMDEDGAQFTAISYIDAIVIRQNAYTIDLSAVSDDDWPDGYIFSGLLVVKKTTTTYNNETFVETENVEYKTEAYTLTKDSKTWQGETRELAPVATEETVVTMTQELLPPAIQLPPFFSAAAN